MENDNINPENQLSGQLSGNPPVHHRSHPATAATTSGTASFNAWQHPPAIAQRIFFPQYERPCSSAFQCLIFLIVAVIVIAGLVAFIIYLLQPHPPNFQIKSVSVSPFAISNSQINAVWYIHFSITNPNYRTSITCEKVESFVFYGGIVLSSSTPPSLHLPKDFHGLFAVRIPASYLLIANDVANAIVRDWEQGVVAFNFKVHARISFDPSTLMGNKRWITVTCENVKIMFNVTGGSMMNGLVNCKIDLS